MDVQLYDTVPLTGIHTTKDGYLAANVNVARSGIQIYDGSLFGMSQGTNVRIYRPEEEVFAEGALKSYAHRPVTVDHPTEMVDAKNWKKLSVGHTGDEVARDGDFVRVSMLVMDSDAVKDINAGKRELSMGYSAHIVLEDGIAPDGQAYDGVQTVMRMNHLAIVAKARGGSKLKIGDNNQEKDDVMPDITTQTVLVDGLQVEATAQSAVALNRLMADNATLREENANLIADHASVLAERDETIGELTVANKQLTDSADDTDLDTLVADRADLVAVVKTFDAAIDPKGRSNQDLRRLAVIKKMGDDAVTGASDDTINGMFKALSASVDPVRDALKTPGGRTVSDGVVTDSNEAYTETVQDLQDAWMDKTA